jgi:hypothetical protein
MGVGANVALFRYLVFTQAKSFGQFFVRTNIFTTSLTINGLNNFQPGISSANITYSVILPPASRGGSIHSAARVAVIQFTGALPPGLVTRRQSIVVLVPARFEAYQIGQVGVFRGLPVELVHKIDGRPDINGQF